MTTRTEQHTPTPWQDSDSLSDGHSLYSPTWITKNNMVGTFYGTAADAAFIVTAVNAHEALVDIAARLLVMLRGDMSNQYYAPEWVKKIEAALALVDGK